MAAIVPFDHRESRRRRDNSELARAGRELLRKEWHPAVDRLFRNKTFRHVDRCFADALTNFPSAVTHGYIWASQPTLAANIRTSPRTAERCVRRFKDAGLLDVRRRGTGRSAIYILCIDGEPLFPNAKRPPKERKMRPDPTQMADQDPTQMAGQTPPDPTRMAEESCKSYESLKRESGQRPSPPPGFVAGPQRRPKKPAARQAAQNNVVSRLGNGDIKRGWLLFGALEDLDQKTLEEFEHDGVGIDDALLAEYRRVAMERLAGGAQP